MLARRLVALFAATVLALPAQAVDLAAHRALYELSLASARGDVVAAVGTMSYDITDSCDGWAVHQQLAMTVTNRDGQDIEMLSDYTTWETKDGKSMRFRTRQTTEQAVTSEIVGEAEMGERGGEVRYAMPPDNSRKLPRGTLFPVAHTEALLQAALAGKRFVEIPLFDGTSAEGGQDSSVAITAWGGAGAATPWPELAKLASGKVHIAFFDPAAGLGQPEFEVSMRYWENGVSDEVVMDFGEFSVKGRMKALEIRKKGC